MMIELLQAGWKIIPLISLFNSIVGKYFTQRDFSNSTKTIELYYIHFLKQRNTKEYNGQHEIWGLVISKKKHPMQPAQNTKQWQGSEVQYKIKK